MALADSPEHAQLLQLEAAAREEVGVFGACPLSDKARVQKLSAGIQGKLAQLRALARELELLAEELDSDEERQGVVALLSQHKGEYAALQQALKAAALAQRAAALRGAAADRAELLGGGGAAAARQRQLAGDSDALAAAEGATEGLRRTRAVLGEELQHTSASLAAMEVSQAQLARTGDEYRGQHAHLKRSRGLLGTLDWQNKSETYMLWGGLTVFMLVVAYIAQKRALHFVPEPLRPASLLRATGLPAYLSSALGGRQGTAPPLAAATPAVQPVPPHPAAAAPAATPLPVAPVPSPLPPPRAAPVVQPRRQPAAPQPAPVPSPLPPPPPPSAPQPAPQLEAQPEAQREMAAEAAEEQLVPPMPRPPLSPPPPQPTEAAPAAAAEAPNGAAAGAAAEGAGLDANLLAAEVPIQPPAELDAQPPLEQPTPPLVAAPQGDKELAAPEGSTPDPAAAAASPAAPAAAAVAEEEAGGQDLSGGGGAGGGDRLNEAAEAEAEPLEQPPAGREEL